MKLRFLILFMLFATAILLAFPQQPQEPLTQNQVMLLVKYGVNATDLAEKIKKLGIDFEPTDEYLQDLRKAGAEDVVIQALHAARRPMTRDQIGKLVAGGVPNERAAALVRQRGIDFLADETYLQTLRLVGADDTLISAVREASAATTGQFVVETSPSAEVSLDGEPQGRANAQGELAVKAKLGTHVLKVSLAGKIEYEESVTVASLQGTKVEARLEAVPGSIRLRTLAGASIYLDGTRQGSTDPSGELVLGGVSPGPHDLRVSAPRKKNYQQSVTVLGGKESLLEATLEDLAPGAAGDNPKDGLPNPGLIKLREGTDLKLTLSETISSRTATVGDLVHLTLDEDLKAGNVVVARRGCKAVGEVAYVRKAGIQGKSGELNIRLDYLKVGDYRVRLRGTNGKEGEDLSKAMKVLSQSYWPMTRGKDADIIQGTHLAAFVDEDINLPAASNAR